MDERIREHAKILVEWSTEIQEEDNVVISASEKAKDLVIALHEELGKQGAKPITIYRSNEARRLYLKNFKGTFETPEHLLALIKQADVLIGISSDPNLMAMNDVPGETLKKFMKSRQAIQEEQMSKRWCGTQHPTNAQAQMAEMSLEAYKDFVYGAILRDWQEIHDRQEILKEKLDEAREVYIEGPDTEITLSIDGMLAVNSDGHHNMPSGEVFTAPVVDSVDGEILFDKPLRYHGHEIEDVKLKFEQGEVVKYSAKNKEKMLATILETDEGAKRLGELGIGTNQGIDRFTKNMLFDEKMGNTIHMALGRAYEETVGENREQNQSAIHVDMIKDMSKARMTLDGKVIIDHGTFLWEEDTKE